MSTPAQTDGATATFISAEAAQIAYDLFKTFAKEANAGQHGGDFDIRETRPHTAVDQVSRAVSHRRRSWTD